MKRVLISGSHGFVGTALKKQLLIAGMEVIEAGNSKTMDLCEPVNVQALPKSDVIIHLAALNFIPESFQMPGRYYRNNLLSTLNLLEKARTEKSSFVFLSTYVYGTPQYLPVNEIHPRTPQNPYTQSKVMCEDLCLAYNRDYGVPVTIYRPFNIYGQGQNQIFFIPKIIAQLNQPTIDLIDPKPRRDFIHVGDVARAIVKGLSLDSGLHLYNLGSGKSIPVKDVVEMAIALSGSKAQIRFTNESRQGEVMDTVADISAIKKDIGWQPEINLEQGLMELIQAKNGTV